VVALADAFVPAVADFVRLIGGVLRRIFKRGQPD
jgi:hypothetical protein